MYRDFGGDSGVGVGYIYPAMKNKFAIAALASVALILGLTVGLWYHNYTAKAQMPSTLQPVTSGAMTGACPPGQGVVVSTNGSLYPCVNGIYAAISPLTGTTGSIGGSLLASVGATATGTVTISGAQAGQPCIASASDGTNMVTAGFTVHCDVTSANTATVTVAAIIIGTPGSKTYSVRIP